MRVRWLPFVLGSAAALALAAPPAGAQVKAGPEFRANSYTPDYQRRSSIAVEPDGDFIVTWDSYGQDGNSWGAFGQRFNRDGTPRGAEFQANTSTAGVQYYARAAVNAQGKFVVVWMTPDGSYYGISAQRYDSSGNRVGGEFSVNTVTADYQLYPRAAMDARGNFEVVWQSYGQDGSQNGVFARRYDASGTAQGAEFQVNTFTAGSQETPSVDMLPDGRSVVVWESPQDGSGDGVYGQRYDASGNRLGAEFQVNTTMATSQDEPQVGMAADGRFVVAFEDDSSGTQLVRVRRFDAGGSPVGNDFLANTNTTGSKYIYGIAVDAQGNFVVSWDDYARDGDNWGVFGQRFSSTGTARGGEFLVNTTTADYQGANAGQADEVGNFVVTWNSYGQDGSYWGIYAQRFGGLFPISLVVDSGGNRVWEPGETVDVRPGWRNLNGAPQTFAGTLGTITGPSGAVYNITDSVGNYGTVPNGANGVCTDCYGVSVNNPNPRPVQHWDASAVESITPDTQGQQKAWVLHIGNSFSDVPNTGGFYRFVETLLHFSITGGCGGTSYCPASSTSREQMAVFVLVAKEGAGYTPPACTTPVFTDVPASSPFCKFIEELFRRGVVAGCGGSSYCPTDPVTREQMAVFVLKTLDPALNPPACTAPVFADVPASSPFCKFIEELVRRGVVVGCGGGNYCPLDPVTREQMGVFISVTFGLTLYGP